MESNSLKKKNLIYEIRYELLLFFFFMLHLITMIPQMKYVSHYVTTHYILTYELGFNSRFMLGSIISLFTDNVTYKMYYVIGMSVFIVLSGIISVLLGRFIRKTAEEEKDAIQILIGLFLSSTYSVLYLLQRHYGRLDAIWIILTLLSLIMLKNKYMKWAIPVMCFLAVAVHQGYLVTYMPALAIPLLYEVYKNNKSKKSVIIFVLSCGTMITFFLIFQLFPSKMPFETSKELAEYLAKRTSMTVSEPMLYLEYYSPVKEWLFECIIPLSKCIYKTVVSYNLFTSAPVLIAVYYIWINVFKKTDNKLLKFIMLLCMVAPVLFIPASVAGTDEDRWWAAVMNNQFIILFYFIFSREELVVEHFLNVGKFFRKNYLILLLIVVFLGSLTFSDAGILIFRKFNKRLYVEFFEKIGVNYKS